MARSCKVSCPSCNETGTVDLDLNDLDGDAAITCRDCDTTFSVAEITEKVKNWQDVLDWIKTAPAKDEGDSGEAT